MRSVNELSTLFASNMYGGDKTIKDVAEDAGLHPSTVSRILKGEGSPRIDTVVKLLEPTGLRLAVVTKSELELADDWFEKMFASSCRLKK